MAIGDLCTYAEVVAYAPVGQGVDQSVAERLITAASRAISRAADREFATLDATEAEGVITRTATDRRFSATPYRGTREIPVGDMAASATRIDLLDSDGGTLAESIDLSSVMYLPHNRRPDQPITAIHFPAGLLTGAAMIEVTAEWGFPAVPADVRQACIAQVREWYVRDVSRVSLAMQEAADETLTPAPRELSSAVWDVARGYQSYAVIG